MHRASVNNINSKNVPTAVLEGAKATWDDKTVVAYLKKHLSAQIRLRVAELTGGGPMACDFATSSEVVLP